MMAEQDDTEDAGTMPLIDHLTELRDRLKICVIAFAVLFAVCIIPVPLDAFDGQSIAVLVFFFLQAPLAEIPEMQDAGMITTGAPEFFIVHLKVAFFTAIFVAFPLILLQIWRFIAPGLYKSEKLAFMPFLVATPALFFLGGAVVYYVVLPLALDFFLSYQYPGSDSTLAVEAQLKVSEYLSLTMLFIFTFGLCFQLPVVLLLMAHAGLVSAEGLAEKRKYAVLIAFVVAAFLTPPDPMSQIVLASLVIFLYEASLVAVRVMVRRHDDEDE